MSFIGRILGRKLGEPQAPPPSPQQSAMGGFNARARALDLPPAPIVASQKCQRQMEYFTTSDSRPIMITMTTTGVDR